MVTAIEYGQWSYRMSPGELMSIAIPLDVLMDLYQRRMAQAARREGWEVLPGPPHLREIQSTNPIDLPMVIFIWPVCREVEQPLDDFDAGWSWER